MAVISINDEFFEENEAKISVKDRGFRFGDGIFDTMSFYNKEIYRYDLHIKRIKQGLKAIKINCDTSNLEQSILKTIDANKLNNGLARIAITRGEGSKGYLPTYKTKPTIVIEAMKRPEMDLTNINLCISPYKKTSGESLPVNYKLMQGLNSTLCKIDAKERGFFDAIMLNEKGYICECSSSNIFWIKDNNIYTPSLKCGILNGVMRQIILEKIPNIKEGEYKIEELEEAEELIITNISVKSLSISEVENIKIKRSNKLSEKLLTL